MPDFMGLMKQAAELKGKMEAMQAELDQIEVEGQAGGGLLTVKLSAKGEMKGVRIDPSLIQPDETEIVADLILPAHAHPPPNAPPSPHATLTTLTAPPPLPPRQNLPP